MKKIMFIFGTRPEAIKIAPVIHSLKECKDEFLIKVCITAQHRELLDNVLETFRIEPDYDLNIMQENQQISYVSSTVLLKVESILKKEKPSLVIVHGDTTTTMASTMSSFYQRIPVAHVEAGLRTYNKYNPFPEEVNRLVTDIICSIHFAPTQKAKMNLLREGIKKESIFVTGNTVIDALRMAVEIKHIFRNKKLLKLKNYLNSGKYRIILITAHRRENFGKPLENICFAIKNIVEKFDDVMFIYPVHPNPNVRRTVYSILKNVKRVFLTEPVEYLDMVNLIKISYFVLTDSGGLQEEVPSLGKPVLVLREVTERPEAVEAGTVRIAGTEREGIEREISQLLINKTLYKKMSHAINPYGDGKASPRIRDAIRYFFGLTSKRPQEFK